MTAWAAGRRPGTLGWSLTGLVLALLIAVSVAFVLLASGPGIGTDVPRPSGQAQTPPVAPIRPSVQVDLPESVGDQVPGP